MTFLLIPGAGGSAWYWHRVVALLEQHGEQAIAVDLPADDDDADLITYADIASTAVLDAEGPLTVVGQSMGALTAPIVAERLPTAALVLLNPMVPRPGESPGQWWTATDQQAAQVAYFREIGLGREEFDFVEDFFHDVPAEVRAFEAKLPSLQVSERVRVRRHARKARKEWREVRDLERREARKRGKGRCSSIPAPSMSALISLQISL